jgi:hypothetical protein
MLKIQHTSFVTTVSGTTGTAQTSRPLQGLLNAVYFDYSASMPSTTNVILSHVSDNDMPSEVLLTINNNATDGWYRPRANLVDHTGIVINNLFDKYGLNGYISLDIEQGLDGETVKITILYEGL